VKKLFLTFILIIPLCNLYAAYILIPMDETQQNHLKAYGIAYWVLQREVEVDWLLNYKGGSFMCEYYDEIEKECVIRGVSHQIIADAQYSAILIEISDPRSIWMLLNFIRHPRWLFIPQKICNPGTMRLHLF